MTPEAQSSAAACSAQPARAQVVRPRHVDRLDLLAGAAGALEDHRQALEARLGEEGDHALDADLAVAQVDVAVAVRTQLGHRVVDVQRLQAVAADHAVELVDAPCPSASRVRTS